MKNEYYYNKTIRALIASFGMVFKDIQFETDSGQRFAVPLRYSPKEKALEYAQITTDYELDNAVSRFWPRLAFELVAMSPDTIRANNPLVKMKDATESQNKYMLARRPFNFYFNLYIGSKKMEDTLKIAEQILPFFSPDLIISIKDRPDYDYVTDIPIALNTISYELNWNDDVTAQRLVVWTLTFTMRAWLYVNDIKMQRIKETILKMGSSDFDAVFETLTSTVDPRKANKNDPHTIIDNRYEGDRTPAKFDLSFTSSQSYDSGIESGEPSSKLDITPLAGETNEQEVSSN